MLRNLKGCLMMRLQVQSFQVPRWVVPVVVLIAVALIPFALVLGLALTAAAVGFSVLRLFLPASNPTAFGQGSNSQTRIKNSASASNAIDAEYQVKDEDGEN